MRRRDDATTVANGTAVARPTRAPEVVRRRSPYIAAYNLPRLVLALVVRAKITYIFI